MAAPTSIDHQVPGVGAEPFDAMEPEAAEVEPHVEQLLDRPRCQPVATGLLPRVPLLLDEQHVDAEPTAERISRPAVNLLGFSVGAVGDKAKNAISPEARAVVGFRLVPDVTPEAIRKATEAHIRARGFHIVDSQPDEDVLRAHERVLLLEWKKGYPALWTDMDLPISKDVARIVDEAVEGSIVLTPSLGGSLPLYLIDEVIGAPILILPVANHDNNQHAPDEHASGEILLEGLLLMTGLFWDLADRRETLLTP